MQPRGLTKRARRRVSSEVRSRTPRRRMRRCAFAPHTHVPHTAAHALLTRAARRSRSLQLAAVTAELAVLEQQQKAQARIDAAVADTQFKIDRTVAKIQSAPGQVRLPATGRAAPSAKKLRCRHAPPLLSRVSRLRKSSRGRWRKRWTPCRRRRGARPTRLPPPSRVRSRRCRATLSRSWTRRARRLSSARSEARACDGTCARQSGACTVDMGLARGVLAPGVLARVARSGGDSERTPTKDERARARREHRQRHRVHGPSCVGTSYGATYIQGVASCGKG